MSESDDIEQIFQILHNINEKVDQLSSQYMNNDEISITDVMDVKKLLSLPNPLRKTITTLFKLVYASAEDVAKITHKGRAVESGYLNQLKRMGYVNKFKIGNKVYFRINEKT